MSDLDLRILLSAVGAAGVTSAIGSISSALGSGGLGAALAATGVAAAGMAVGFGVTAVKAAGDFQSSLTSLVTGAGEAQKNIGMVGDGMLDLSVKTATGTKQLTDGMYLIESAGFHGADGLQVLKAAAEGAKVGNADLGTVANAVTTILTDYHMSANQAASATSGLVATVASGKTHLSDLSSAMSTVLPLASSVHVSFNQVGAAMATMTNGGETAQHAGQMVAFMLRDMVAPSSKAAKEMANVGLSATDVADTLQNKGLPQALQMIEDHVGQKFPQGSAQWTAAMKSIMGGTMGLNGALELGGQNMATFTGNVKTISKAMQDGKGDVQGWSDVQKDFNFKMGQAKEALDVLTIKIGQALLPVVTNLVTNLTPLIVNFTHWITTSKTLHEIIGNLGTAIQNAGKFIQDCGPTVRNIIGAFGDWWNKADLMHKGLKTLSDGVTNAKNTIHNTIDTVKNIVDWFKQWHTPILAVAGAITGFFVPAMIKAGVEAAVNGAKIGASFVQSMIKTGIESVINGAKVTASFVASMAKAGVEAVVNGAKVTASFVSSLIKTGVEGWAAAGKLATFIGSLIASGVQAVASAAKVTASFIASMVQAGIKAVVAGAQIVGSFVASLITTAAQAAATGATMLASLLPALVSVVAEAVVAAATAIPGLVVGFGAWAIGAGTAAAATIAATWPILAIIGVIALVVAAIMNWSTIVKWFQGMWSTAWGAVSGAVSNAWGAISGALSSLWNNISGWFSNLASQAIQWGANIISNLASGITGAIGNVTGAISNVANTIGSFMPHSPAKQGELSHLNEYGPSLTKSFANGITGSTHHVTRAMGHLTKHVGSHLKAVGHINQAQLSLFEHDVASTSPQRHAQAQQMINQLEKSLKAYPAEIARADLSGNKALVAELRQQKRDAALQMKQYKDVLALHGEHYSAVKQAIIAGGGHRGAGGTGGTGTSRGTVLAGWAWLKDDMNKIISLLGGSSSGGVSSGVSSASTANNKIASLTGGSIKFIPEPKDKVLPHHTVVHHHHHYEIHTMARSPNEVKRLVDMIDQEQAKRVRHLTPGYNTGGIH